MSSLRIVFAGSPAAAVPSLERLAASDHDVALVITRPDTPQGRKAVLTPTPVAVRGEQLGIPVLRAQRLADEPTDAVQALQPDLGVIVAFGGLVREPLLSTPRLGWINLHFSLLPRWRGAAPVQQAIMAGDEVTGASVFQLAPELDAGDVFGEVREPIGRLQTAGSLLAVLAESGGDLLVHVVDELAAGTAKARPQVGEPTFAPKLQLSDGTIDWSVSAEEVSRRIRAVTPEPGAHTSVEGSRLKVLEAVIDREAAPLAPATIDLVGRSVLVGTATDPVELLRVHPAGRNAMDAAAWWRGRPAGPVVAS
jgi:methionyl-tRNA formyltransferase